MGGTDPEDTDAGAVSPAPIFRVSTFSKELYNPTAYME